MKKALLYLLPLILIIGCAGNSKSSDSAPKSDGKSTSSCVAPSKTYNDTELDNFLQTSYTVCNNLQEAQELLAEANVFVADPVLYAQNKVAKAVGPEVQKAQELLDEANAFVADPALYAQKIGEKAVTKVKSQLKEQLTNMIVSIAEDVIKKSGLTLQSSGDATNAAKNIPGMDKMKAVKDVKAAINNLKSAAETAPQIVDEMKSLLSQF